MNSNRWDVERSSDEDDAAAAGLGGAKVGEGGVGGGPRDGASVAVAEPIGDAPPGPMIDPRRFRRGGDEHGRRQALLEALRHSHLPGVDALCEGEAALAGTPALRAALALAMRATAALPTAAGALPTPVAAQWWLVQRFLERAGPPEKRVTLGDVRRLLLETLGAGPAPSLVESAAAAAVNHRHALLPLILLHADRPRTPEQRQQAVDRLTVLLSGSGAA